MAEPRDLSAMLEDASSIFRTVYFPGFSEMSYKRFGKIWSKLISPEERVAHGQGITMQYEIGPADTIRTGTDALGPIPYPDTISASSIQVRWSPKTPSGNDFTRFAGSVAFDLYTLEEDDTATAENLAKRIQSQVLPDYEEKDAILQNTPRSGQIALVNGTPTLATNQYYYVSSAGAATNTAGMRLQIDTGPIVAFRQHRKYDFYNSSGVLQAGNIECTDVNVADKSVGFRFNASGGGVMTGNISTGNLASVADNHIITFAGTLNAGVYGVEAWMTEPTAGESFVGGVDRTTPSYRCFLPIATRRGATATKFTRSHFDDFSEAMGYTGEAEKNGLAFICDLAMHNAIRQEVGEDAFIPIPVDDSRLKRYANFGSIGLNYQHGTFGLVKIIGDTLSPTNKIRALDPTSWVNVWALHKELRPIMEGGTHFYRMNEEVPNTGKGLFYKADWYCNKVTFCKNGNANGQILNITPT